ncbi:MAG: hypothetical protein Sapg2KO_46320 [Saprospiraceae bacterium]
MSRICTCCQERLYGRADQKFCSDFCRNQFHNQKKKSEYSYFRRINRILHRNRNILLRIYQQPRLVVQWEELLQAGFDARYCTACERGQEGKLIYYCYDMVYESSALEVKSLQLSQLSNHGIFEDFYKK